MASLQEAQVVPSGKSAQASPTGGWLPSNPRRELGFTFTIPRGHGFEVLLQPWQSQAPDTIPNTFPAPSAAPGT